MDSILIKNFYLQIEAWEKLFLELICLSVHIDNKGNDILILDEGAHKDYMTPH